MQTTDNQGQSFAAQLTTAQNNNDFGKDEGAPAQVPLEGMPEKIGFNNPTPEAAPAAAPPPAQSEIRLGSKVFKSQAELQGYMEELEQTKGRYDAVRTQFQPQTQAQDQPEEDLDTLMFTDSKRFTEIITDRAAKQIEAKQAAETRQKDISSRFFTAYPDLNNAKTLVAAVTNELVSKNELAGLSEDAALSKVAQATRREVAAIRGEKYASQELSSSPARVAGTSSGAPAQSGVQASTPKNMVEQMKARAMARKPVNK